MMFITFLLLIAANVYPTLGKANNNPLCPEARPKVGSVCSLPKGVGCKYRPYTCPEAKTVFLSLCACSTAGTYVCYNNEPPTCACPIEKPVSLATNTRCTVGTTCRYEPVGCLAGIKFATSCECIPTEDRRNTYLCNSATINCKSPNDVDCPARPAFGAACDPTKVSKCRYDPYGCPGKKDGEFYIYNCECDASSKSFVCYAAAVQDCNTPTSLPTTTPCFPGDSLVTTGANREQVRLDKLQIGEQVLVDADRFESVYSFGHRDPDSVVEFLEITTEKASTTLRISADHMIWSSGSFVPAWHLKVGDVLTDGPSGKTVAIVSIRNVRSKGAYAPFTPSGTIVVDGVLASSFVALTADASLEIAGGIELSIQWMARMFESPHRLVCHYLGSCPNEAYDELGVSTWNAMPLRVARWVLEHPNGMVRISLLSVFAGLLGMLWLLENPCVVVALFVGAMVLVLRKTTKTVA